MDEKKHMIQIKNPLYNEIKEYCNLNEIKINTFINELLEKSFLIEKYGTSPFDKIKSEYNDCVKNKSFKQEFIDEPIQDVIDNHLFEIEEKHQEIVGKNNNIKVLNDVPDTNEDVFVGKNMVSGISDSVIEQTPESQAIIDEHMRLLSKKNEKSKRRRLK